MMPPPPLITDILSSPKQKSDFRLHVSRISRQSSVFLAGTIFTAAAGYLFKVYVARLLGAEALGIYALGMTATGLASEVAGVGLCQSATKFVAAYVATDQVQKLRGFLWRGAGTLALLHATIGIVLILGRRFIATTLYRAPEIAPNMIFFVCLMLVGAFTSFFGQALAGYKNVARRTVITNFVGTPITMISVITLLCFGLGLHGYLIGQLVGGLSVLVLLLLAVWKLTPKASRFSFSPLPPLEKEVIAYSTTLLGVQILEFFLAQTDRIALGIFLAVRYVGVYSLAIGLTNFVPIVLQSINQIFSPTIAELHAKQDRQLLLRLYQTITKWTLGFTVPVAFTIMFFARPLMRIFGPEFEVGWIVLVITSAGQLVNCGVGSVGLLLFMSGEQSRALRVQTVITPLIVILNFTLISRWGLAGAAIVSAFANVITNLLYLCIVRRTLGIFPSMKGYYHLLPPSLVTIGALLSFRVFTIGMHSQFPVIVASLVSGYLVFFSTVALSGTNPDDKLIFHTVLAQLQQSFISRAFARQFQRIFQT